MKGVVCQKHLNTGNNVHISDKSFLGALGYVKEFDDITRKQWPVSQLNLQRERSNNILILSSY